MNTERFNFEQVDKKFLAEPAVKIGKKKKSDQFHKIAKITCVNISLLLLVGIIISGMLMIKLLSFIQKKQ